MSVCRIILDTNIILYCYTELDCELARSRWSSEMEVEDREGGREECCAMLYLDGDICLATCS